MYETHIGLEVETERICQHFSFFKTYLSLNVTHRWSRPCSLVASVPNLHPFCRTDAKMMGMSVRIFELSIVPCTHLLECMKLMCMAKLASLAEIMSPTNQKHIFPLACLAVQPSLMLTSMGLLDPDWQCNCKRRRVCSWGTWFEFFRAHKIWASYRTLVLKGKLVILSWCFNLKF